MGGDQVTVYFIGAGPGAADLITVRGQRLLERCATCLYAGSIMPDDLLALCPPDAKVVDTGPLTLDQIVTEIADADAAGHDVARLHSGDPSLYSALAEQCRRLDALGIDYEIVPGVPAFAAAAAALKRELTVPGVAQTVTLTRVATLSTPMPPGEELAALARSGATLVLHLAAAQIDTIVPQLLEGGYRPETPAAVVAFASWPQQTRAARHAGRHRRADARRQHHQDRRHRRRRRAGRRGIHRQLSVFDRAASGGAGTDAGSAARRHRRGPRAGENAAPARRRHQLAGRPGPGSGPAGRPGAHRRLRRRRRTAALAARRTHRRRRRRHPPVRGNHDGARRRSVCASCGCPIWCWPARPGNPAAPSSSHRIRRRRKPLQSNAIRGSFSPPAARASRPSPTATHGF